MFVLAMLGTAEAGGQSGSIGVGAEYGLRVTNSSTGIGLASLNYDAGAFHVGGFLGFFDGGGNNDTNYAIGGRFFYHVHSGSMADFSVGGNLGLLSLAADRVTPGGSNDRSSQLYLEPGVQIRLFIASNVALSFTAGLSIGLVDADGFALGGQTSGAAGVHYYFF
jgi:hypothetical protein